MVFSVSDTVIADFRHINQVDDLPCHLLMQWGVIGAEEHVGLMMHPMECQLGLEPV